MTTTRKPADARRKELELAISRIQHGRARTTAVRLSISAVAAEAGVTPSLIHNHYPEIAEIIRSVQGRSSRAQRDAKHGELCHERKKNRILRQELAELRRQLAKLASVNEVLLADCRMLKAKADNPKTVEFGNRSGR
jgi:AcrR family transcriptional regulator